MSDPTEAEWLEGNDPVTERERMEGAMTDNRTNEQLSGISGQFSEAQVEAAAREWYEQANGYETWASASGKHQQVVKVRATKALVAATRVPVRGEPNDDRVFLVDLIREHDLAADENTSPRDYREGLALGILAAGFSRATVPDAATELRSRAHDAMVRVLSDDVKHAEAERDAALSTIAKVREEVAEFKQWLDENRPLRCTIDYGAQGDAQDDFTSVMWHIDSVARALGSVPSTGEGNE